MGLDEETEREIQDTARVNEFDTGTEALRNITTQEQYEAARDQTRALIGSGEEVSQEGFDSFVDRRQRATDRGFDETGEGILSSEQTEAEEGATRQRLRRRRSRSQNILTGPQGLEESAGSGFSLTRRTLLGS